jgi:hypothetical protein
MAPFGIDYANDSKYPLGSKFTNRRRVEPFAGIYAAFAPMQRQGARWAFEGRTLHPGRTRPSFPLSRTHCP